MVTFFGDSTCISADEMFGVKQLEFSENELVVEGTSGDCSFGVADVGTFTFEWSNEGTFFMDAF